MNENPMSNAHDKPKRRRYLPRGSMATMFVVITIICLVLGLVVWPAEDRRRTVEHFESMKKGIDGLERALPNCDVRWYEWPDEPDGAGAGF